MPSFEVYIDESGDEGFRFNPDGSGSSRWFILSALCVRTKDVTEVIRTAAELRYRLNRPINFPLHFAPLKHDLRLVVVDALARLPVTAISVCVHKPSLGSAASFQQRDRLYFYTARYLLERVS